MSRNITAVLSSLSQAGINALPGIAIACAGAYVLKAISPCVECDAGATILLFELDACVLLSGMSLKFNGLRFKKNVPGLVAATALPLLAISTAYMGATPLADHWQRQNSKSEAPSKPISAPPVLAALKVSQLG